MNNKAFTLMELLTIIVVLSVIALITIPLINDTLQDSKRKISQNSAQQYKKAVDEYILQQQIKLTINRQIKVVYFLIKSANILKRQSRSFHTIVGM